MPQKIDFTAIRGDAVTAQRTFFEQLVCHLAFFEGGGTFRRIHGAGGDGGVEALRLLQGVKIGYQAKYYTVASQIDWDKIDASVATALTQHPDLTDFVIAFPCDFTGKRAVKGGKSTEGTWGQWDKRVSSWEALAQARNMTVVFEPWTAFDLEGKLQQSHAQHLRYFFFNRLVFTDDWIVRQAQRTLADLQARYSPGDHVDVKGLRTFDVIFRREGLRQDLHEVFAPARLSNPRVAAALVEKGENSPAAVAHVEGLASEFLSHEAAVDAPIDEPWPVCQWLSSWRAFTHALGLLERDLVVTAGDDTHAIAQIRVTTKAGDQITKEVFGGHWAHHLPIDAFRCVLFVGRAGEGKSHLLARAAQDAIQSGAPVVHILGQHIREHDPRISILKHLGLSDWSFDDALSALNLAAEAAQTRALLLIDALNEGGGIDIWRSHLLSLMHDVRRHNRVVLVMSCREEYLDYVIPADVIAERQVYLNEDCSPNSWAPPDKLVSIRLDGFSSAEEQENALFQFMDKKGIARPTAPVLDREFFNPLFMSSVCRAMAAAGITVFPKGLHATRQMFAYVLEVKAKALGTTHDGTPRLLIALKATLDKLAAHIARFRTDHVPLLSAVQLIDEELRSFRIDGRTWLDVLEGAAILRRDVDGASDDDAPWSKPNEVIRFSFQRLQDNLVADYLSRNCRNIEEAFADGGDWAFLIKRDSDSNGKPVVKPVPRWIGVLGALWACVAKDQQKELFDLQSFFSSSERYFFPRDFLPIFQNSLRERDLSAYTARTKFILDAIYIGEPEEALELYLAASCVPGHVWNAVFMNSLLAAMSPEELDLNWTHQFEDKLTHSNGATKQILSWAETVPVNMADLDVVHLACITLHWLSLVNNEAISVRARNALARLRGNHELTKAF